MTAVVLASGCVSPPDGPHVAGDGKPCRAVRPEPITEQQLKRAFAAHGIELARIECSVSEVITLANLRDSLSYEERERVGRAEGSIYCDLGEGADGDDARIERFVWKNDPDPTTVRVLNVDCSVFPERRAHTDAVEAAVRELPGVSDAPAVVPSEDARPD